MTEEIQDKFDYPVSFQTDIISYLVKNGGVFGKFIKHVKPSYFTEYQLQDIIESFCNFYREFSEIPTKNTLINLINDKCIESNGIKIVQDYSDYINQIYGFVFNEEYVKSKLVEFVKVQAVYKALQEARFKMDQGDKVLNLMETAVNTCGDIDFDPGYVYKDKENIKERAEMLSIDDRTTNQVMIGIPDIDNNLGGGLGAGELGCIIGDPGGGKTIFLMNFGLTAAAQGYTVLYCTMESSKNVIAGRADHNITQYTTLELKKKKDKMMYKAASLKGDFIIKEFPTGVVNSKDIKHHILDMKSNGINVDMVVIDYIAIMGSNNSFIKERRLIIQDICQGLTRDVAKFFKIPVWTAQQSSVVNYEVGNSTRAKEYSAGQPSKSSGVYIRKKKDIAEAKVIITSECDYVISINPVEDDKGHTLKTLIMFVIKNRHGDSERRFSLVLDTDTFTVVHTGKMSVV